jgi:selenocysteine-specific elongation factor
VSAAQPRGLGRPEAGRRHQAAGLDAPRSTPLTLGTAGHIDHGKTALVAALTGVDTDRLPAEKARGISIELGYAPLALPSGRRLSVVDVPGHERFVRTMVAGATGIDLYLMVVAADDGVMPQTVEHAAVLAALAVNDGVVAVTKADLADPAAAAEQARDLLGGTEVVACSARTGAGVSEVRAALDRVAARLPGRAADGDAPILHVDRAFTIHGTGTGVTGTLWAGSVAAGDRLVLLGDDERSASVRVRSVQVHDEPVERAQAGQRVALNLAGLERRAVARGDVVAAPGAVAPTTVIDCALSLRGARHGTRVHVHHGTREAPARLAELGDGLWQARLERPLLARAGDRVVVRAIAPPDTLGGGVVLDPAARRHGRRPPVIERLQRLRRGEPEAEPEPAPAPVAAPAEPAPLADSALALEERLRAAGHEPPAESELDPVDLRALRDAGRAVRVGRNMYAHPDAIAQVRARVEEIIAADGSITLARLRDELATSRRYAQALLEHLDADRVTKRLPDDSRVLRRR